MTEIFLALLPISLNGLKITFFLCNTESKSCNDQDQDDFDCGNHFSTADDVAVVDDVYDVVDVVNVYDVAVTTKLTNDVSFLTKNIFVHQKILLRNFDSFSRDCRRILDNC